MVKFMLVSLWSCRPAAHRRPLPCDRGPAARSPPLLSPRTRQGYIHLPKYHPGRGSTDICVCGSRLCKKCNKERESTFVILYWALPVLHRFFKGRVLQDFQHQVFFMNQFPPSPYKGRLNFFSNIWGYVRHLDAPPLSATQVANRKKFKSEKF